MEDSSEREREKKKVCKKASKAFGGKTKQSGQNKAMAVHPYADHLVVAALSSSASNGGSRHGSVYVVSNSEIIDFEFAFKVSTV